jgi:hypothetical protein
MQRNVFTSEYSLKITVQRIRIRFIVQFMCLWGAGGGREVQQQEPTVQGNQKIKRTVGHAPVALPGLAIHGNNSEVEVESYCYC